MARRRGEREHALAVLGFVGRRCCRRRLDTDDRVGAQSRMLTLSRLDVTSSQQTLSGLSATKDFYSPSVRASNFVGRGPLQTPNFVRRRSLPGFSARILVWPVVFSLKKANPKAPCWIGFLMPNRPKSPLFTGDSINGTHQARARLVWKGLVPRTATNSRRVLALNTGA